MRLRAPAKQTAQVCAARVCVSVSVRFVAALLHPDTLCSLRNEIQLVLTFTAVSTVY